MSVEIKLPEIGDGIESGDVLEVLVHEGDVIEKNQDIVELETDKATTGVPSTHAGKVVKVHVREGDTIPIGGTIITLDAVGTESETPAPNPKPVVVEKKQTQHGPIASKDQVVETPTADEQAAPTLQPVAEDPISQISAVAASPAMRRLARETGVDLKNVTGTGKDGRITREDILTVVRRANQAHSEAPGDHDAWGPIRTEKLAKIRKTIAAKMHESWSTVPRVTNFDDADITELEEFRQDSKADYAAKGIKLTTMPFVLKAVAMSLKSHPLLNATIDLENGNVIYKDYVNIGIAVDTQQGLVVPVLRSANEQSISVIARNLAEMAANARDNKFSVEDLRGGTFTISNLGAIGGTYSTPIINVPEVAILLIGRARKMPVVVDEEVAIRLMMPVSLSYDHRLVDGATAARFLNDVINFLSTPSRLLLAP